MSIQSTMTLLADNFRQYFSLTSKLSLQDMATYMEFLTSKKLLVVPQTIYCPTDGIKLNIKKLPPKYLNREIKIKISGVATNVSALVMDCSIVKRATVLLLQEHIKLVYHQLMTFQ